MSRPSDYVPKNPTKFTPDAQERALESCRKYGNRSTAAMAAGVEYDTLGHYIRNDPDFGARWEAARQVFIAVLENEARRRAVEGWPEPRMGPGGVTYDVQKFDGALLLALLKANDPKKYRDQVQIDQTTKVEGGINLDKLSAESRAKLREILEAEGYGKQEKEGEDS